MNSNFNNSLTNFYYFEHDQIVELHSTQLLNYFVNADVFCNNN